MAQQCLVRKGWGEGKIVCYDDHQQSNTSFFIVEKNIKWVLCEKCEEWFHLACQGIKSPMEIENISFFCTSCKEKLAEESPKE